MTHLISVLFIIIGGIILFFGNFTRKVKVMAVGTILLVSGLLTQTYIAASNFVTEKTVDLPEEIEIARHGELLRVEKVTKDSIVLGFSRLDPEYKIELIDQENVSISNGKEHKIIPFDSIQSYIQNDNL